MSTQVRPRDLQRRKFQHVAATVLDGHAQTLRQHDDRLNIVTTGLADLTGVVGHNAESLQKVGADLFVTPPTFRARLRWLVFGR